jgi:hypothetical protein
MTPCIVIRQQREDTPTFLWIQQMSPNELTGRGRLPIFSRYASQPLGTALLVFSAAASRTLSGCDPWAGSLLRSCPPKRPFSLAEDQRGSTP